MKYSYLKFFLPIILYSVVIYSVFLTNLTILKAAEIDLHKIEEELKVEENLDLPPYNHSSATLHTPTSQPFNNNYAADTVSTPRAKFIILNKITTKPYTYIVPIGMQQELGNLLVKVYKCIKYLDPYNPDNKMLISIYEKKLNNNSEKIFKGWIMSSNLSISSLEHAVYELIPLECTQ